MLSLCGTKSRLGDCFHESVRLLKLCILILSLLCVALWDWGLETKKETYGQAGCCFAVTHELSFSGVFGVWCCFPVPVKQWYSNLITFQ